MPDQHGIKRSFFISRTGVDKDWARWIAQVLEEAGHTTIFQDRDFLPGHSFVERMEHALATCDHTIVLLSPEYLESDFTKSELRGAFTTSASGKERAFIPILVRKCEIPTLFRQFIYIDFVGKGEEEARDLLLRGVSGQGPDEKIDFPGATSPLTASTIQAPAISFPGPRQVSVARLPTVNSVLIGREDKLRQLDDAWSSTAVRVVSIIAFGGVGKTALSINWWHRNGAPGAKRILGWCFYSQGAAEDSQASADAFLDYALRHWFEVSEPPKTPWERGELLAKLIRSERTLLILDGLEAIQLPPGPQFGLLTDEGMVALLKELAAQNPGLCICTSRFPLTDLADYHAAGVSQIDLDNLTPEYGATYLRELCVRGEESELQHASVDFGNHALALTLLGSLLKRYGGDVRKRDSIPSVFEAKQGTRARRILLAYESLFASKPELDVLRMLGLFDGPAEPDALVLLRQLSFDDWALALENLSDARLIQYQSLDGPIDCHPLVREHFADEFRKSNPNAFREAHSRLYDHYFNPVFVVPATLEEMAPLFRAVRHGCLAGRYKEAFKDVYHDRIQWGSLYLLTKGFGAFSTALSLVANFFESRWGKPVHELAQSDQGWVLSEVGSALRAVGRLAESLEPMSLSAHLGLAIPKGEGPVDSRSRTNAAIRFGTLAEVQLALARLSDAAASAARAINLARRPVDAWRHVACRARLAAVLHQSGRTADASAMFEEADRQWAAMSRKRSGLTGLAGAWYWEFLLDQGRHDDVLTRARNAWPLAKDFLDTGICHLFIGRTLDAGSPEATNHLEEALKYFRRAAILEFVPPTLLASAIRCRRVKEFLEAQYLLDEVHASSSRYGMRLCLTDCHLEQTRLLLCQERKTEAAAHHKEAKQLTKEVGYHRRDAELARLATQLDSV